MKVKNADGRWVHMWEDERARGAHRFLKREQIERLEFLDENWCVAAECWDYLVKARQELADVEARHAWRGQARSVAAEVRAAQNFERLIRQRVDAAIARMELADVGEELAGESDQDYKLLLLERLSGYDIGVEEC